MGRTLHIFFVLSVLVGITVAVVLVVWLGGRSSAKARDGVDVRLVAAVTRAEPVGAWLGMTLQPVTDVMRKQLKLPRTGVVVSDVAAGSPAAQAGVQAGDLLRQVGDTTIKQPEDVPRALREAEVGARLTAMVWRQGQTIKLLLTAASPPAVAPRPPAVLPEAEVEMEVAWLGLDIVPLSPREAREANLGPGVQGMLVDDVADGRGVDAGITTGDVIVAVNGKSTRSIAELKAATRDAAGALVDILRRGRHLYVSVPPPGTTPAERKLMQQRLPLTRVNWDGYWPVPNQQLPLARGVGLDWLPPGYASQPITAPGGYPAAGALRDPRLEDWRRGLAEDWQRRAFEDQRRNLEDWRQRLPPPPGYAPPGMGAFAVGR